MAKDHQNQVLDRHHPCATLKGSTMHFSIGGWETDVMKPLTFHTKHLELDGRHFYNDIFRNEHGMWHFLVYLLGPQKDADNYHWAMRLSPGALCKGNVASIEIDPGAGQKEGTPPA